MQEPAACQPLGIILSKGCTTELVAAAKDFAFTVCLTGARAHACVLDDESQVALKG